MDMTRNKAMNECPVCGMAKRRMERHLVDVHGYSQGQISEFKAQKKSRRIAVSGKPVYSCDYCDAKFISISELNRHKGTKHAQECLTPVIMCPICRETVNSQRELAEHAHQQHVYNADEFVVESINFQSLQDYQVREKAEGRRSQRDGVSSVVDGEAENEHDGPYSSDGDEEMMEVVVEDDVKNESVARSSTDVEDRYKDMFQKMEMMYASARESMLKVMREPTEGTQMESEQALQQMDELTRRLGLLAENVGRNGDTARLARRHDVPSVGCPQALTPIRKLHKRTHLRKAEQAKRKPVLDIPDCAQDEREACAVCIRMQPISGSTKHRICWIQCPTCEDWMYTDCISNNVCPRDGAELRRNDV
ncbi:hypothetical protein RB195_002122 [Necator americanus]|uniref:C2H2-type domain-containing protein n=1 Tax=Necator americanus TaxID=51031 RepID=A0ABR1DKC4_NECAM